MINTLVGDLTTQSAANIAGARLETLSAVRIAPCLIDFSPALRHEQQELKKFLHDHLYRHYKVARMSAKARHIIQMLFNAFRADIRLSHMSIRQNFIRISIRQLPIILRE